MSSLESTNSKLIEKDCQYDNKRTRSLILKRTNKKPELLKKSFSDDNILVSSSENISNDDKKPIFIKKTKVLPYGIKNKKIYIPMANKYLRDLTGMDGITLRFIDFYHENICLEDCTSSPHTAEELEMFNIVVSIADFYFSQTNITQDPNLRALMDNEGWVDCYDLYESKGFHNLNIPFEIFVTALEHSMNLRVTEDRKYVRSVYSPGYWYYSFQDETQWKQVIIKPPSVEKIKSNQIEFNKSLIVHGCNQRIAAEFNRRLKEMLQGKTSRPSKYIIEYHLLSNEYDDDVLCPEYPNLSRKRGVF